MVDVTRHKNQSLEELGSQAVIGALRHANDMPASVPTALYVGNMLSGILSHQQHLGPLIAGASGLIGPEAFTAEGCCGAGGAALHLARMAIASGQHETVVVVGVEQMTHSKSVTQSLATASHWSTEGSQGKTFVSLNAYLMQEYMLRYNITHDKFAPFALLAHANAATASHAVFKGVPLTPEGFAAAKTLVEPITLMDACPTCDGAAAIVLTANRDLARGQYSDTRDLVIFSGSAAASDILPVAQRSDVLELRAVVQSTQQALLNAGIDRSNVDIFELHDAYTIMACLSLEAAGFAPRGKAWLLAAENNFALSGSLPISTFGGLKARGHPVGATGVYQAVEMLYQLRGLAGRNTPTQGRPRVCLTQNIGGAGGSVFTGIFTRE